MNSDAVTLHLIPNHVGQSSGLHLGAPVFAHIATPCGQSNPYAGVDSTVTGIVCGNCSGDVWGIVRHASVSHVAECFADCYEMQAQQREEIYAEGGYDRWAEGGWDKTGAYSYDPYDRSNY